MINPAQPEIATPTSANLHHQVGHDLGAARPNPFYRLGNPSLYAHETRIVRAIMLRNGSISFLISGET